MLVCNVSLRNRRTVAADIAETAGSVSDVVGLKVLAVLIDENAFARDTVDATTGLIIRETATAVDVVSVASVRAVAIVEQTIASSTQNAIFISISPIVETATASSTQDATIISLAYTAWNPSDKTNITLSNANLTAAATANSQAQVRAVSSKTTGKYYFEVTISGTMQNSGVGISVASPGGTLLGPTTASFVNVNNGFIFVNGSNVGSITGLISGQVACVAVDLGNKRIWYRRNGDNWNNSGAANPATNTGGIDITSIASGALFPLATFNGTGLSHTANFGATSFAQTMPSGFTGWPT